MVASRKAGRLDQAFLVSSAIAMANSCCLLSCRALRPPYHLAGMPIKDQVDQGELVEIVAFDG
jgi:hypothetical protein